MFRPRVIPVLLLRNQGLVKTVGFDKPRYIGDPINAVKLFNDLQVDELVFLDILASREGRCISPEIIKSIGDEANMPFAAGGGICSVQQIEEIIKAGAEKVVINTAAIEVPHIIKEASQTFGSSTIVVSIDVKKKFLGKRQIYTRGGTKATGLDPVSFAQKMEQEGAGELFVTSIEKEGLLQGYDNDLIHSISAAVSIPVVAHGGAGKPEHFTDAVTKGHASAVAAGSRFVYHGPRNAVLINYPTPAEIKNLFSF
ncbi:MAG: AglZ/HisF2 family acetamidino modification protein [Bacteroidia bacterium]|jgi:cyclase